ncbi:MAG: enoyl-CoA hydratase [Deltaproteobacteria bacterium ADurb.Bin207]|nr:MAG: enoyl-CoA hydratase [Deltaproteobacteria bacterium ADurb.Bin207]
MPGLAPPAARQARRGQRGAWGEAEAVLKAEPEAQAEREARAAAQRIAGLSPQALRLNKRALRQFVMPALSAASDRAPHYAYAPSAEHREGLAAFNEKRKPRF